MRTSAALRRAVLESPNSPSDRITYAQALERAGDTDGATAILDNLHQRREGEARCGSSAGLPVATTVALKWGMIAAIEIDRQSVDRLGDVLREHPVERIHAFGPGVRVTIRGEVRGVWDVTVAPAAGGPPTHTTSWRTRQRMVAEPAAWVLPRLPADIDDSEQAWFRSMGIDAPPDD